MLKYFIKIKKNDKLYLQNIKQKELNKNKFFVKEIGYYKFEQKKIHRIIIKKNNQNNQNWQITALNGIFGEYYTISRLLTIDEIKIIFNTFNILKIFKYHNIKIIPKINKNDDWISKEYYSKPLVQKGLLSVNNKHIQLSCYTLTSNSEQMFIDTECWSTGEIFTYATVCYNNYFIHSL